MGVEYSFYDTETGGMLEKQGHEQRYEQALQLAIVACDDDFNELEAHDLRARRKPNYVPSAGAQATTGIRPRDTDKPTTTEYDMATAMVNYINKNPATIWMAWNHKFDTPVVRETHFRSLHDPLATTSGGNTRSDGMRIFKASYCFATNSQLAFPPSHQRGRPSLKLGNVAAANGVVLIGAHDGINDTRALVRVCQVMKERDPHVWSHMQSMRTSQGVDNFLQENLVFLWTAPDATSYSTSAYCYAAHKGQGLVKGTSTNLKKASNEMIIVNLAVDPESWRHKSDREILMMMKGRDPANPDDYLDSKDQPFKIIKRNDQPILWPYMADPCLIPGDTGREFSERERDVSRLRDSRLSALSKADLEARRKSIQDDQDLCNRLSILADRMWKYWDRDKNMWVEGDKGPKLLEDRIYDGIGLNMPPAENGKMRMFKNWFHARARDGQWSACEEITMQMGELFPKQDPALRDADTAKYDQLKEWRDYTVTMKRLGMIVLYEKEIADGKPGAYLQQPANRFWVESYIHTRLTQPAVDSKGEPLKKPKYRTIDDAERLAHADIEKYHANLEKLRAKNELTPDLSEEYARRIAMSEECLEYYAEMRANLKVPVPAAPSSGNTPAPEPLPLAASHDQYHAPDDHDPLHIKNPVYKPTTAPAPAADKSPAMVFGKVGKPAGKSKPAGKAGKTAAIKKNATRDTRQRGLFTRANMTAIARAAKTAAVSFNEMVPSRPTQAMASISQKPDAKTVVKKAKPAPKKAPS